LGKRVRRDPGGFDDGRLLQQRLKGSARANDGLGLDRSSSREGKRMDKDNCNRMRPLPGIVGVKKATATQQV
jgi:hypothetical protein